MKPWSCCNSGNYVEKIRKMQKSEWGIAATECNYKELDRQLKEQFIYGLNHKEMIGVIIKKLTTIKRNDTIKSEIIWTWAKSVEAQRAQVALMKTIMESKEFHKIRIAKSACKVSPRRSSQSSMPSKQMCRYCSSIHPPRQCPAYGKTCVECNKTGHL